MASIAGTYFTSWEFDLTNQSYQLGPIVVIGTDNSVVVDGVTMNQPMISGTMVTWSSAAGNPSSAMLVFVVGTSPNPTTFSGTYWMSGDDAPTDTNFYGFDTQPQAPLSSWANTYYSYEKTSSGNESLGNLVISGTTVTFAGKTINNPIYTGLYVPPSGTDQGSDTNELAWFTTDGNDNNVAISFFNQQDSVNFNGDIWGAGENRPVGLASTANNFFGTTQSAADADAVDLESVAAHVAEAIAVGLAVHAAVAVAKAVIGGNNDDAADDAEDAADNVDEEAAPAEEAAADDEAGGDDDAAGDDAADGGDDALEDVAEVVEDVVEDIAEALVVLADTTPPNTKGRKSKDASGLSSKQLLDLKNGK